MSGRYEPNYNVPEIPTVLVMKQVYGYTRYRFRIASEDVSHAYLRNLEPGFYVKWSANLTTEDIAKVEAKWGHKIIKEKAHAN